MRKLFPLVFSLWLLVVSQTGAAATGEAGENAQYVPIDPALVVNITDGGTLRFLQVNAQFKVTDTATVDAINKHNSAIRHTLLLLLAEQSVRTVYTTRGKERLRKQCLEAVRTVLNDYTNTDAIENIYFTGFIVQ